MFALEFDSLVRDTYGIEADFPFKDDNTAVYRHKSNKKWFAIVLKVKKSKLIHSEDSAEIKSPKEQKSIFEPFIKNNKTHKNEAEKEIDVVNLKCTGEAMNTVWLNPNIYPGYHMNKHHWISIPLDGTVDKETVLFFLDISYNATMFVPKKRNRKTEPFETK